MSARRPALDWETGQSACSIGPAECSPIKYPPIQCSKRDHECYSFISRQTERDVERHPVPNQVEAVDQIGVPAQFPAISSSSAMSASTGWRNTWATAATP